MKSIIKKLARIQSIYNWRNIDSLGKMRFSKTSYYYIIIVPILIKLTEALDKTIHLKFGETIISLNLQLPFSWITFYFGAIFIAIGSLLYLFTCPKFIKRYSNYNDFVQSGESDSFIFKTADINDNDNPIYRKMLDSSPFAQNKETSVDKNITRHIYRDADDSYSVIYLEDRKNLFNNLYNKINYSDIFFRVSTFLMYIIGFAMFLKVIIQNIYYVLTKII